MSTNKILLAKTFVAIFFLGCCPTYMPPNSILVQGAIVKTANKDCDALFSRVRKKWTMDNRFLCYHYNRPLLNDVILHKSCFFDLRENQIIGLFGEPNLFLPKNSITYSLTIECEDSGYYGWYTLNFRFRVKEGVPVVSDVLLLKVVCEE
jgi:hypothetical protein